MKQNNKYH